MCAARKGWVKGSSQRNAIMCVTEQNNIIRTSGNELNALAPIENSFLESDEVTCTHNKYVKFGKKMATVC